MMSDWKKEAEEEAKKYSQQIKNDNQQVLDALTKAKESTLKSLDDQQNNAIYNLNRTKSDINANAAENAKQLNINRLINLKSNEEAMNRAGLGSQGIVGSQVNSINNNYSAGLSDVLNTKSTNLKDLETDKNNTVLEFNKNRSSLNNEYDTNYANTLSNINDKALQQYNTVFNNYMAYKQQEYENKKAEEARLEAIRQYNENLKLQREQMIQNNNQFYANLNKQPEFSDNQYYIKTDYYDGNMPLMTYRDLQLGAFNTKDKYGNYYQPDNVNGQKLSSIGLVKEKFGKNATNSSGVNVANQKIWKSTDGKFYIWNGSKMAYEQIQIH